MVKGKVNVWLGITVAAALGCGRLATMDQPAQGRAPQPGNGSGGTNPGSGGGGGGATDPGNGTGGATDPGATLPPETAAPCTLVSTTRVTDAPGASTRPAIAWMGNAYLVVWADERGGPADLYMTTLDVQGARVGNAPDTRIAHMTNALTSPSLARLADGRYVVVFEICGTAACDGANGVGAVMLGPDGHAVGQPVELSPAVGVQRRPYVTAAFGGAYATFRDVSGGKVVPRVVRLGDDGAASMTAAVMGGGAEGLYPHVAAGGDRLALVYRRTAASPEIVLDVLDQGLAVQNETVLRTGNASDATNPVVAWNGLGWSVAWEEQGAGEPAIFTSAAAADGSGPQPDDHAWDGNWPAMTSNGRFGIVAFYGFPAGAQIFLTRVGKNGQRVGDVLEITDEPDHGKYPAVAHDPTDDEIGVVWQDDGPGEIFFAHAKCP